ncbi:hypothetical protein HB777_29370 [Mesorhizobium loti]|nr:hypothetical protein HB777_29370 [Mesorhizobium loti]
MAEALPLVVGDPSSTKVKPVLLVDALGNPIDATHPLFMSGGGTAAAPSAVVGNVASGVADAGAPVKVGGIYNTTQPTIVTGQRADAQSDVNGNLRTFNTAPIVAGADAVVNANLTSMGNPGASAVLLRPLATAGYTFNGTTWDRQRKPNAASRIVSSAATTNATVAKASAGDLLKVVGLKATAANCFLKIYNKATAPTVGTDTPVLTIPLFASQAFNFDLGGMFFATGISYAITALAADADTTAIAAGDVLGLNVIYA